MLLGIILQYVWVKSSIMPQNFAIIGSDTGLSPVRCRAIIFTIAGVS